MIEVGDKVVCINDTPGIGTLEGENIYTNGYIEKNKVYVIENIRMFKFSGLKEMLCFDIIDKPIFSIFTGERVPFGANRFRKLEDVKMENELKYYKEQFVNK